MLKDGSTKRGVAKPESTTGPDARMVWRVGARIQVLRSGEPPAEVSGKAAAMAAIVALEAQVERRRLALLLWPDSPEPQARGNLRTLVHRLNRRLGAEVLTGAERLGLDPGLARIEMPGTQELLDALRTGAQQAGELLAGAGLENEGAEALDQWLAAARQRMRREQLDRLSASLKALLQASDPGSSSPDAAGRAAHAIELARACVQLDPLSERWHRQLMDTLARCGDRAAALAAYEDCKELLLRQLGVLPDTQTRTVQLRILQGQAREREPALQSGLPLAEPPAAVAAGLTPLGGAARYPLVERDEVLAQVRQALSQGLHVALRGEAGVGKTRLLRRLCEGLAAEQVAIRLGARHEAYAALTQVLQEVQVRCQARVGLPEQVELARFAPLAFPDVEPSRSALSAPRVHAALLRWFEGLGQAGVRHLVLDDLHHADAASQVALAALLAERPPGPHAPPTLLLTHRDDEIDATLAQALANAQARRRATSMALQRLSPQGVRSLLQAMQAGHDDAATERLLRRTGGNPLFLIELARQAMEGGDPGGSGPAVDNLAALLRSRLAGCSAPAQQLAALAAIAAQDFSVELASAVTGQTPLALMHPWGELQRRGLFADHGLAHELMREAALQDLPGPIARELHRQLAGYLEAHGFQGAKVLAHWIAAEDFDRALPHAVHRRHTAHAAGLSTVQLEIDLLALMARLSDEVLLANLWVSAEVDGGDRHEAILPEQWHLLEPLVARVERLPASPAATEWLAYERARLRTARDGRPGEAWQELLIVAERMPATGVARTRVETFLGLRAKGAFADSQAHALRAKAALAGVEDPRAHRALEPGVELLMSMHQAEIQPLLRAKLAARRAARRRFDEGAVEAARTSIASICSGAGLYRSAWRYYRSASGAGSADELHEHRLTIASHGLVLGRFDSAFDFLQPVAEGQAAYYRVVLRAIGWLHLGLLERARHELLETDWFSHEVVPMLLLMYARVRRELDTRQGGDPMPVLREVQAHVSARGESALFRRQVDWEVAKVAAGPRERMAAGDRQIEELKAAGYNRIRLSTTLLEAAEAHAAAGSAGARALALEAAREIRRSRVRVSTSLPAALVRCARVLQGTDPGHAAALTQLARRWVLQALPHVPDFARGSFTAEVPVHRLLLQETDGGTGADALGP